MFDAFQCPRSLQPLRRAPAELVVAINHRIAAQQMVTVEGQAVDESVEGGWYCTESGCFYAERGGIVNLVADEALDIHGLPQDSTKDKK